MADRPIANIADNPEWVAEAANWDIPATAYAESTKESITAQGRTVPQWFIVRDGESVEIRKVSTKGDPELLGSLVSLWRKSVEATHTFLTNDDIERIAGYVPQAIENVRQLTVAADTRGTSLGFIGVDGDIIEMLFVHPEARGKGVGKLLLSHAVSTCGANKVDVNEQNEQARGFYERMGFRVVGRSETDDAGDPFPILHMHLIPSSPSRRHALT